MHSFAFNLFLTIRVYHFLSSFFFFFGNVIVISFWVLDYVNIGVGQKIYAMKKFVFMTAVRLDPFSPL